MDLHRDVGGLEQLGKLGFLVAVDGLTVAEAFDAAEHQTHAAGIHLGPAAAHGSHDAAPVGVLAVDGGLDQLGVAHGAGDAAGVLIGGGAAHGDVHDLAGALAVLDQHVGDLAQDVGKALFQQGGVLTFGTDAGSAVGQAEDGIVGGGIAVHADAVEGLVHGAGEHGLPGLAVHIGVGEHDGQHGGHVGADHARALGHAGKAHGAAGQGHRDAGELGKGVGGHERAGKAFGIAAAQAFHQGGHGLAPAVHLELVADDAGGHGHDLMRGQPGEGGDHAPGLEAILQAFVAGTGIGLAGVGQHGAAGAVFAQGLLADLHGGGLEGIGGKQPRQHGGTVGNNQPQVVAAGFFETGGSGPGGEAEGQVVARIAHGNILSGHGLPGGKR